MNPETVDVQFCSHSVTLFKNTIFQTVVIFLILMNQDFLFEEWHLVEEKSVLLKTKYEPNTRYLKFQGSIDHVTVMPVVSATGQVYTPRCYSSW